MSRKPYMITKKKYLLDAEVATLENSLNICKHTDPRNALLIELALKCGARCCELIKITRADLDPQDCTVFVTGAKGSNDRAVPLSNDLFARLLTFAKQLQSDSEPLFPVNTSRIRQIWYMYTPNKQKGFHSLRHTYAIHLYRKTKDIMKVKKNLGHRNIQNTMVYTEVETDKADLAEMRL